MPKIFGWIVDSVVPSAFSVSSQEHDTHSKLTMSWYPDVRLAELDSAIQWWVLHSSRFTLKVDENGFAFAGFSALPELELFVYC